MGFCINDVGRILPGNCFYRRLTVKRAKTWEASGSDLHGLLEKRFSCGIEPVEMGAFGELIIRPEEISEERIQVGPHRQAVEEPIEFAGIFLRSEGEFAERWRRRFPTNLRSQRNGCTHELFRILVNRVTLPSRDFVVAW